MSEDLKQPHADKFAESITTDSAAPPMTKAVTSEDVMRLIQEYRQTFNPFADLHDEHLALEALESAISAIIEERDVAAAERKELVAGLTKYRNGLTWTIEESLHFNGLVSRLEKELFNDD